MGSFHPHGCENSPFSVTPLPDFGLRADRLQICPPLTPIGAKIRILKNLKNRKED
jgi:hypothetical protein